ISLAIPRALLCTLSLHDALPILAPVPGDVLSLPLPTDSTNDRIRERCYAWLQKQARSYFDARLAHFCGLSGVTLKAWRIASPARSEEHTSELQSREIHICRLQLE